MEQQHTIKTKKNPTRVINVTDSQAGQKTGQALLDCVKSLLCCLSGEVIRNITTEVTRTVSRFNTEPIHEKEWTLQLICKSYRFAKRCLRRPQDDSDSLWSD